jgi:uncharacterized membrane protein
LARRNAARVAQRDIPFIEKKETIMSKSISGARMAAMAAAFAASSFAIGADMPAGATGKAVAANDTVHCYGVNSCKGQGDCKTATNSCKGQAGCKGMGFKAMKASECLSASGTIGDIK